MKVNALEAGDSMGLSLCLSAREVSDFARLAGDENPIHHDPEAARRAGYARPVISGAQLSSRLMGLSATHFSCGASGDAERSMLGLGFRFSFHRPVLCDETVQLEWRVVSVRLRPALGGHLVLLEGGVRNAEGQTAIKAEGKVLAR